MALTHVKSRHDIWTSTQRSQGIGDLVSVLKTPVKLREGSFEALIDTAMCGILEVSPSSNEPHISRQSPSCSQVNCKSELLMKYIGVCAYCSLKLFSLNCGETWIVMLLFDNKKVFSPSMSNK